MLLFVYNTTCKRFVIFTYRYFKLSWNTTALKQLSIKSTPELSANIPAKTTSWGLTVAGWLSKFTRQNIHVRIPKYVQMDSTQRSTAPLWWKLVKLGDFAVEKLRVISVSTRKWWVTLVLTSTLSIWMSYIFAVSGLNRWMLQYQTYLQRTLIFPLMKCNHLMDDL